MGDLIRIGGLWKNKSKDGKTYISGGLGYAGKIVIFQNEHKKGDNDPDYVLYLTAKPEKDENTQGRTDRPWD